MSAASTANLPGLLTPSAAYKPFRYPWAHEFWKKQQQVHWMPEEIPLGEDLKDWAVNLSDSERNLLTQIFRFFTQSDIEVADNYMERYGRVFKPTEVKMMLSSFANMETIHIAAYALLLETPLFDATQERVSPTDTRDRQVRQDGVDQVAGAARGAVFRLVGSDPSPFARISRELSGSYLLAFEAADSDRDSRAHRIRVTLARGRHAVRARTHFTMPPATAATAGIV